MKLEARMETLKYGSWWSVCVKLTMRRRCIFYYPSWIEFSIFFCIKVVANDMCMLWTQSVRPWKPEPLLEALMEDSIPPTNANNCPIVTFPYTLPVSARKPPATSAVLQVYGHQINPRGKNVVISWRGLGLLWVFIVCMIAGLGVWFDLKLDVHSLT